VENKSAILNFVIGATVLGLILLAGFYFFPWENINWGGIKILPGKTITVVGEAQTQEKNQIATFTAGVTVVNDSKEAAVAEVNQKIEALIAAVKSFGIKDEDVKTQSLNVSQREETYYEEERQKTRPGQWSVGNTIEIKLRDVERASALADLLTKSGATNVWGPNFTLEEAEAGEDSLLSEAIKDAQSKAEVIAQASGGKLGKILTITEGYQQVPVVYRALEGGGGGAPVEPGSTTVQKVVTVVFELR